MNIFSKEEVYTFPNVAHAPVSEQVRKIVHTFIDQGNSLTQQLLAWLDEHFQKSAFKPRFFLELCLVEIFANIVKHDMLDIHGTDAEIFLSSDWQGRDEEFLLKFEQAKNLYSIIILRIEQEGLVFSYTLSKPFPGFEAKWKQAKDYNPSDEQLETTCGNGTILLASFFDEAIYDSETLKISFYRSWKDVDWADRDRTGAEE